MNEVNEKSASGFATMLRLIAALSAALAIVCFVAPAVRKSGALHSLGEKTISEMSAAVTAISYYSAQNISELASEPAANESYKFLAGLLNQINAQQGYDNCYLLFRAHDKTLQYLVDGNYRDNALAGTDYFVPEAVYPTSGAYKAVKNIIDKIYSGKSTGGYTTELITRQDLKKVSATCLPVYGSGHAVVAVLCIETDPGNTAYHMVSSVNLYYAGLILAGMFLCCLLILTMRKKYLLHKQARLLAKQEQEQTYDDNESPEVADSKVSNNSEAGSDFSDTKEEPEISIDNDEEK